MKEGNAHLETKFVFLDTETFVREKFDWNSRSFSRLKELAKSRHVRILTTSVTKNEVKRKIRETLGYVASALNKYEIPLGQLGVFPKFELADGNAKLEALFEAFLSEVKAIEVPLAADLDALFGDYFGQRPPFSERKKSEFPDAVVVSSLRQWCAKRFSRVYVVSGDPFVKHDDHLRDELIRSLQGKRIRVVGRMLLDLDQFEIQGTVYHASEVSIQSQCHIPEWDPLFLRN